MTNQSTRLGRYARVIPAVGAAFLVGATATGAAQSHGGGGAMGGGWLIWPLLVVVLLALAVFWAGSRGGTATARTEESDRAPDSDRALETLRERYARGDISEDEFERRRRKLHTQG